MSGRFWKWCLVVVLLLISLYAVYPPVRVAVKKVQITEKVARTREEADAHGVQVGQSYAVDEKDVMHRLLPLAAGRTSTETEVVKKDPDGTTIKEVTTYQEARIKLGLDIAGGTELLYELKGREGEGVTGAVSQTIKILSQRIDPQNVKEFRIQPFGQDRILIQVPGASREEVDRLKQRLTRMGRLEFRLALAKGAPEYAKADRGEPVPGYTKYYEKGRSQSLYLVKDGEPAITGQYLESVDPAHDERARPAVGFLFNAQGRKKFALLTERNIGWPLAIILDGTLYSAPVIEERISGSGIIKGEFTQQEVEDMITVLRAGSLPVDLELLQESTVGPQLGRDSITQGLRATVVGAAAVLIFMAVYYLSSGIVAGIAIILNVVFVLGVLGLLGAALTLPGVAGLALTIGMGVDANVLIFERIREEVAAGKNGQLALRNGYDRAYITIFDSNMTTILTGVILYIVGTGAVRGFAVTLVAGIALNLFTALTVTRLIQEALLEKGWVTDFRMRSMFGRPKLSYTSWRRFCYVGSLVFIVVGVVAFFVRGSVLYDVDFTGGSFVQLSLGKPTPLQEVRRKVADAGFPNAEVQAVRSPGAPAGDATDFGVRIKGGGLETIMAALKPQVEQRLRAAGVLKDGNVTNGKDGHSIVITLGEAAGEMAVRKALAGEGGDPFRLKDITQVVPAGDMRGQRFIIKPLEEWQAKESTAVWEELLGVLAAAGLKREPCSLSLGEVQSGEDATAPAQLQVTTGKDVQWQLLATEMRRLRFYDVKVEPVPEHSNTFILKAPRPVLERFKQEAPTEVRLPVAIIEATSVEGELEKPFSENDLRAIAERKGLGQIGIAALDATTTVYTLQLSYERVKERLGDAFAGMAADRVDVKLEGKDEKPDAQGRVTLAMSLSRPLTLPEIQYRLEEAGLGAGAQDIIVDRLPESVRTQSVTLRIPAEKRPDLEKALAKGFGGTHPVRKIVSVGAVVAEEMKGRAILAVICAWLVILFYVALRFHAFRWGVGAVISLAHDITITVGMVALADWLGFLGDMKINLSMIAAFLTILGYSINDTIVVFDRIRENLVGARTRTVSAALIDQSVNQVLSRTVITSLTTLLVTIVLYFMGGPVLQGMAFALTVGIIVGTYSSVFVASPVLIDWNYLTGGTRGLLKLVFVPFWGPFWMLRAMKKGKGEKK